MFLQHMKIFMQEDCIYYFNPNIALKVGAKFNIYA